MTGVVAWFTGLPGSGKTTLARRVRDRCVEAKACCVLLDGDEVRAALSMQRAFDEQSRDRFYAALAALAAMLARQGLAVLVAATAHRRAWRDHARALAPRFLEVHVSTPLATCEARDRRGLYVRGRAGEAPHLPGLGEEYEPPLSPDVTASGGEDESATAWIASEILAATPGGVATGGMPS